MSGQVTVRVLTAEQRAADTGWDEGDLVYVAGVGLTAYDGAVWGGVGGVLSAEVMLTDDEIKALGANPDGTYTEVVPAPGTGKVILFERGLVVVDMTNAGYGNLDASVAMQFTTADGDGLSWGAGPTTIAHLLNQSGDIVFAMFPQAAPQDAENVNYLRTSQVANEALCLMVYNASTGAFTGGDSANSMRIKVWYTIEDMP